MRLSSLLSDAYSVAPKPFVVIGLVSSPCVSFETPRVFPRLFRSLSTFQSPYTSLSICLHLSVSLYISLYLSMSLSISSSSLTISSSSLSGSPIALSSSTFLHLYTTSLQFFPSHSIALHLNPTPNPPTLAPFTFLPSHAPSARRRFSFYACVTERRRPTEIAQPTQPRLRTASLASKKYSACIHAHVIVRARPRPFPAPTTVPLSLSLALSLIPRTLLRFFAPDRRSKTSPESRDEPLLSGVSGRGLGSDVGIETRFFRDDVVLRMF